MAREFAFAKQLKISQAQQYMLIAVLMAGIVVGVSVGMMVKMISGIDFSANVIAKEEESVAKYEKMLENVSILRNKIVDGLANDAALKSVAREKETALQVIPDALPAYKNEEALLASLNKIFQVSDWEPENIQPTGEESEYGIDGMRSIGVSMAIETDAATVMRVLDNINRSIREFDINQAKIEWSGSDSLSFRAQATAYYTDPSALVEKNTTMRRDN